ncbi:MAG TPA: hydroxymethylglutaryl-CoA synthase [Coxiellaceae bacterium]|nr:hydroxymethylglutaryl-CoA synthase [Coxiellaceae bacterium]
MTMYNVGIDVAAFYTPHYFLDLKTLAEARGVEADKFYIGLGQHQMSVPAPDESVVTMGANAAQEVLKHTDINDIEMLLFATESGVDYSKAAGIYVHQLLNLNSRCRVLELKQACYSSTGAIRLGLNFLQQYPTKKVLVIASDIARYGLNTPGESSQGAGAVALLLSVNPRLLTIDPEAGFYTEDTMDFWRPHYRDEALVEGKYSCELYLKCLEKTWAYYQEVTGRAFSSFSRVCYHVPLPRLAEKAHHKLTSLNSENRVSSDITNHQMHEALQYNRVVGNCYTGSLYLSLLSLLDHASNDLSDKRLGFYSYGSGCVAEFFSGTVRPGYRAVLNTVYHQTIIKKRQELSQTEYEAFYSFRYPQDGSRVEVPHYHSGVYRLSAIDKHKPIYEKILTS